jgi:hypothetical protein
VDEGKILALLFGEGAWGRGVLHVA